MDKERMIVTKTVNSFFVGLVQISTYTVLGALHGNLWLYGIVLGLGATAGNGIGKKFLHKLTGNLFRIFVIAIMVISGILLVAKQFQKFL